METLELTIEEIDYETARRGERVRPPGEPAEIPIAFFNAEENCFCWLTRIRSKKRWWKLKLPENVTLRSSKK